MKNLFLSTFCAGVLLLPALAAAEDVKTYQVTGPILDLTPTTITVQKGDEKWQLARDKSTKGKANLKVGESDYLLQDGSPGN